MEIGAEDTNFLLESMKVGEVVLILGAGASVSSTNSQGENLKSATQLARLLAERTGMLYTNEKLVDVLNAVKGQFLSDRQILDILKREYLGSTPSPKLQEIFRFTWKRIYTWNFDDTLQNLTIHSEQRRRYYNGLTDKAVDFEGPETLHVVYLHGEIAKPEHGLILSEVEYSQWMKSDRHYWYQRAAQDYIAFCPVFVGSTLDEPILSAELERAKRETNSNSGRAFLVTPDDLSEIRRAGLRGRGIVHLKGTLESFSAWLSANFRGGNSAKSVISQTNHFPEEVLDSLNRNDLEAARALRVVDLRRLRSNLSQRTKAQLSHMARSFLRGFPPDWTIAASNIPVMLEATSSLQKSLDAAIEANERIFVVIGQAGSGKTTAIMMALLNYINRNPNVSLYDLNSDVRSPRRAYEVLRKIRSRKSIVYAGDLFLFSDSFRDDLQALSGQSVIVVTSARTGEWRDRLARHLPDVKPFSFERFSRKDYDPLIDRLVEYVPAPGFRKLPRQAQYEKLKGSKSQLLIALREATESQIFSDIITNEFEKLPDEDTRALLLSVGLATLARVGLGIEAAREAYSFVRTNRTFDDALSALEGIVERADNRRLYARHELYVRHIFENVVGFQEIASSIKSLLRTYVKYDIPIVRNVGRLESALFRFLFNHDFIFDRAKENNEFEIGRTIYSEFEVEFQLDGHFWLQYGLYLADIKDLPEAVEMLRRSVQAYQDNTFAHHALADVQLRYAKQRQAFDSVTRELISEAVKALKAQDARNLDDTDIFPAVTLAFGHVGALMKHAQEKPARAAASEYFTRLQELDKHINSTAITAAKDKMMRFLTLGEWVEKGNASKPPHRKGGRRRL